MGSVAHSVTSNSLSRIQIRRGSYHSVSIPPTAVTTPPSCFRKFQYWVFGQRESPELIDTVVKGNYNECVSLLEKGFINVNTQDEKTGKTALHYAAKSGKLNFVQLLLEFNASCNIVDGQGNTPLHLAVLHVQTDCCKIILECHNVNINLGNNAQETPLHIAIKKGDMNIIEMLLEMNPDCNQKDYSGNTPLHIAAESQLLDLCNKLVLKGNMINEKNKDENTPLHIAAKAGNSDVIDFLRSQNADCNTQNLSGDTPLHLAAKEGHSLCIIEILKYDNLKNDLINNSHCTPLHSAVKIGHLDIVGQLLDNGANCNALDNSGDTPLHLAITKGYYTCCEKLLKCNELKVNQKNKAHEAPLHTAARIHGRKDECHLILQHPDVKINIVKNKLYQTPLHLAAQVNNYEIVNMLLEKGANWRMRDKYSYMPLHYAAECGSEKSCEYLMKVVKSRNLEHLKLRDRKTPLMLAAKGGYHRCCKMLPLTDINEQDDDGNTALFYATKGDFLNTVSFLLTKNADTTNQNNVGRTVLHQAAMNRADSCLAYLLQISKTKDLVNVKDTIEKKGFTPLHEAINTEALQCAQILLEHEASVKEQCHNAMTALHLAAKVGDPGICSLLLSYESDVNEVNNKQETPLHIAAKYGSRDACTILVRKGTQVLAKDKKGRTALHLAAGKGYDQVVKLLIKKGLSPLIKDDDDSTALHLAAANGHLKCCDILVANAKHIITEVDKENKLALERAFENQYDEVFAFLIKCLKPKKEVDVATPQAPKHRNTVENEVRRNLIHKYMHQSLRPENNDNPRLIAAEAIIESDWWMAGFFTDNNDNTKLKAQYCTNFRELINHHPCLALKAQDRCCQHSKTKMNKKHDFRLFENHFCLESESSKKPVMTYGQGILQDHPVSLMVQHTRDELLQHQLTDDWLMHLWNTYVSYILTFLLFTQVLYLLAIHIFMVNVDNWSYIQFKCNTTQEDFCRLSSLPEKAAANLSPEAMEEGALFSMEISNSNSSSSSNASICYNQSSLGQHLSRIYLFIMTCFILIPEVFCFLRLWTEYFNGKRILRIIQLLLIIISLLPIGICGLLHHVISTWRWYCGIVGLLLEWLLFFNKVNELPVFFIFMPVTNFFLWNYIKALVFILSLLFAFSCIFHVLLTNQAAFSTIPDSMMKMFVWLLGDLNYGDTFLESTVVYPDMAKIMFVGFIIIMGGFIANLAIGQPSDRLDKFRKNAAFAQKSSQATLFLEIKACFPTIEKLITKFLDGKGCRLNYLFDKVSTKILTPSIVDEKDIEEDTTLQNLKEQVAILVDLGREQREEMRDLKLQLNNLFRRMPQLNETDRSSRKISQEIS